ncbi:MAG: outer membrane beta-barrel protein [bacterium]
MNNYRINYIFLVLITLAFSSAFSYSNTGGFKIGANVSSLPGGEEGDQSSIRGINCGIFYNYQFCRFFSIQPEIYFTSKGKEDIILSLGAHNNQPTVIYYVEMPILAKFTFLDHGSLKYNVFGGPYVSRFITGVTSIPYDQITGEEEELKLRGKVQDYDYGLTFGLQLDIMVIDFRRWMVSVDIRRTIGLKNIDTELTYPWLKDRRNSTNSAMVSLGYRF